MDISPIPAEDLEPFASSKQNIEKDEKRRYSALFNEIGKDRMIEDIVEEADVELWKSRRPLRAARTSGWSTVLSTPSYFVWDDAMQELMANPPGQEDPEIMVASMGTFGLLAGYGLWQHKKAKNAVKELAKSMEPFTEYNVVEPYEVGRFDRNNEIEDLLLDARTIRAEPRIEELYDDDEYRLDDSTDAVRMYREVLNRLEEVHDAGVEDETAEGVNLYGSGFLEPFFSDTEAVHRAEDIQSSGVAQVVKTKETQKNMDGTNELLTSDYVFRLELVYNGQTVAKFDGTCTEDNEELGEPLLEEIPQGSRNSSVSFSKVMNAYEDVGEDLGMTFDKEDYTIRLTDRGGIPRHLYDTTETVGRSFYGVGRGVYHLGRGLARAIDVRGAKR